MTDTPDYIKKGAFVRLRNGKKAEVVTTEGSEPDCVIILVIDEAKKWISRVESNGYWMDSDSPSPLDIIGPWIDPPKTRKIMMYPALVKWSDERYTISANLYETLEAAQKDYDDYCPCPVLQLLTDRGVEVEVSEKWKP